MVIREKEGCQSELVNARDSSSHFKYCFTLNSCQIGICLILDCLLTKKQKTQCLANSAINWEIHVLE
jgi:hypothetical protein